MGERGPKPKNKVKIKWSPEFAYALGLLATDGNLSPDKRHINFTSKDRELVELFAECLSINNRIGRKARGGSREKKYFVVQFGDVRFYRFLVETGITPKKSKTLGAVRIPHRYFFDFLRGLFDGDGTFYSYFDRRWRSSYMFYIYFYSASRKHVLWLQSEITNRLGIVGHLGGTIDRGIFSLRYAKKDTLCLLKKLYYSPHVSCLNRKRLKIKRALSIIGTTL